MPLLEARPVPSQIATNALTRRSGTALVLLSESGPSSPDKALTGATNAYLDNGHSL